MEIGIFTNTPAHVHLYRSSISELERRGHDVTVFARDDGPALDLLDYYDIGYHVYGSRDTTTYGLIREFPSHLWTISKLVRQHDFDLMMGMGVYSTFAAMIGRCDAITIMDSEPMATIQRLGSPFVSAYLTPASFQRDLGSKHFIFDGFKETAYLHPDVYNPDSRIREELGISTDEPFAIVRFNAFNGHHDVGKRGFTIDQKRELVERLSTDLTVFISDESGHLPQEDFPGRPYDAHPASIHHALDEAALLIADTQTMVTEAALLGTPAIRSNSFVGDDDMGNFHALEQAGLVFNLSGFESVLETATELLRDPNTASVWEEKREAFLADKCNLTAVIVNLVEESARSGSITDAVYQQQFLRPRNPQIASPL